jgi:hypothetical protein
VIHKCKLLIVTGCGGSGMGMAAGA